MREDEDVFVVAGQSGSSGMGYSLSEGFLVDGWVIGIDVFDYVGCGVELGDD